MDNKKIITYKIMSQNELSNVGTVTITDNSIIFQVQEDYISVLESIANHIITKGEFNDVVVEDVKKDTVSVMNITNVSEKYVNALKEECALKLGLIWI
jgi:hypothetical protein